MPTTKGSKDDTKPPPSPYGFHDGFPILPVALFDLGVVVVQLLAVLDSLGGSHGGRLLPASCQHQARNRLGNPCLNLEESARPGVIQRAVRNGVQVGRWGRFS